MELASVDFYAPDASKAFTDSLKENGFAILETHPVDWELIEHCYVEFKEFMCSEAASKYEFCREKQDGYYPLNQSETAKGAKLADIKHFYHMYFPWGRYPTEVSNTPKKVFEQQLELGRTLLGWIDKHMDPAVASTLKTKVQDTLSPETTLQRFIHYPGYDGTENAEAVRAAAHEDINIITLLPQGTAPGLELRSKKDGKWYPVKCKPKSIIVNIGDMLQEMTGGNYVSTTHRVIKYADEDTSLDRVSMPVFVHAKPETYISERYPTAREYLDTRLKELKLK